MDCKTYVCKLPIYLSKDDESKYVYIKDFNRFFVTKQSITISTML